MNKPFFRETVELLTDKIEELRETIKDLSGQVRERDDRIRELSGQVREGNDRIRELIDQMRDKDNLIQTLGGQIDAMRSATAEMESLRWRLDEIQNSLTWRIGQLYGKLLYRKKLSKAVEFVIGRTLFSKSSSAALAEKKTHQDEVAGKLKRIVSTLNERKSQGVFIITSAFEFDEFYNQRVINLSKYLAARDFSVVYVAWRWTEEQEMNGVCKEVYPEVFQVPVDYFYEHYGLFSGLEHNKKYFIIEFPHPECLPVMLHYGAAGFTNIYDIVDDWEEFHRVGQAPWFGWEHEEAIVMNADVVAAVSPPLIAKFSHVRRDMYLIPNGFSASVLGGKENISGKGKSGDRINVGYFGHLTGSWIDWDLVFEIAERNDDFVVNLIGYGEPVSVLTEIKKHENIKFHGRVQPTELHEYAKDWEIAILPFKDSVLSRAVDPIKIYEYLFFGLPTVVQGIPHLGSLPYTKNCGDAGEFSDAVREFAERKRDGRISYSEIKGYLKDCTWDKRFAEMVSLMEHHQS